MQWLKEDLEAGAWKVITEAREGGTAGIFRSSGDMRTGLIDEIVHELDLADIVFEAPTTRSQAWFIQKYGPTSTSGTSRPRKSSRSRRFASGSDPTR